MLPSPLFALHVAGFTVAAVACLASSRRLRDVDDADTRRGRHPEHATTSTQHPTD